MEIEAYSFGEIVIDGEEYNSDILIFPDGQIDDSWWRDEGHALNMDDITSLVKRNPELIIAGTGAYGKMKPDSNLKGSLKEKGIELIAKPTEKAVKEFNRRYASDSRAAACLHLTC